jgi:hypothetical protein
VASHTPFNLPPGRYRLEAQVRFQGGGSARPPGRAAGLQLVMGLDETRPAAEVPVLLPVGALKLQLDATAMEGRVTLLDVGIVPEAVVPVRQRRGIFWPRTPVADMYRVGAGELRVTAFEGCVPAAGGFRIEGDARFAVEGPLAATVEVWIERQPPEEGQVLHWGGRRAAGTGAGMV